MSPGSAATAAQQIAGGYAASGQALELGTVVVDDVADPAARVRIPLATVNRHGLIAGATGTGKTKTLQVIAEQLSAAGVAVLMADVKGDLSGLARPGEASDKTAQRARDTGDAWSPTGFPVEFLSLGTGGVGVPVRATISTFGPVLLSKVLGLNATQEATLGLIFHWADQNDYLLLDVKDLRAVISYLTSGEGKPALKALGAVSPATAGVILRAVVNLEAEGADAFFGEPELKPEHLIRTDHQGRGVISLLELGDQAARPVLFSTFLMWVLADLFTYLPEVGDVDKPKLVFVFDEAILGENQTLLATILELERNLGRAESSVKSEARTRPPTRRKNNYARQDFDGSFCCGGSARLARGERGQPIVCRLRQRKRTAAMDFSGRRGDRRCWAADVWNYAGRDHPRPDRADVPVEPERRSVRCSRERTPLSVALE